jgi:hypothetical protein
MSYSLTPIVVDLQKVNSLMGSKDVAVLQAVIKKYLKEMLNTDAMGDDFEEYESEIKAEYKKFVNGDFSGVDLNATYPEREDEEDEEDDEEAVQLRAEYERLKKKDPKAAEEFVLKYLEDAFKSGWDEEDEDEDDEDDDGEIEREVTSGTALAQLILGGNTDKSAGYKYGYALCNLCEYFGETPDHDSWCTIRYQSLEAIDALLKKAGIKPSVFSAIGFLVERGSPVKMPKPDDFPGIGYLTRDEARKLLSPLDPAKIQKAIRAEPDAQDWFQSAIDELREWLELCAKTNRDLICFYF